MLALGLVGAMVLGVAAQDGGDPGVPGTAEHPDHLAAIQRAWSVALRSGGATVDLQGDPHGPRDPQVAFRVDGEVAFVEGVLTIPEAGSDRQLPLFNLGARIHALSVDPALPLAHGSTLSRIFPGPLDWAPYVEAPHEPGGVAAWSWAGVPVPAAGGSAPGNATEPRDDLRVALWFGTVGTPLGDPAVGIRSPALARLGVGLWAAPSVADPEAWDDWTADVNVTLTLHVDFVAVTAGRTLEGGPGLDAAGLYLRRGDAFATVRTLGVVDFAGVPIDGAARHDVAVGYDAPRGRPVPGPAEDAVWSPTTFNVTAHASFASSPNATFAGGPATTDDGAGLWFLNEFGFLASAPLVVDAPSPTPDGPPAATPGPAVLPLLGALLLVLGITRSRRFLR